MVVRECEASIVSCGWFKTSPGRLVDRIEMLRVRSDGRVAGFWRCLAKFGVARPRFVVPTRRSVAIAQGVRRDAWSFTEFCSEAVRVGNTSAMHAEARGVTRKVFLGLRHGRRCGDSDRHQLKR